MVQGKINIQISRENKFELDKLKLTKSETYEEVLTRILDFVDASELTDYSVKNKGDNMMYIKEYKGTAIDYYENNSEKEGLIGKYSEYRKAEGIEYLCDAFEDEIAYLGYATSSKGLAKLIEKWGVDSGEGSNWVINEFSNENHYCIVYCAGQNKGSAIEYDEALSLFYDESNAEIMLEQVFDKFDFDLSTGWDLREFLLDLMDAYMDETFITKLDTTFKSSANISVDEFDDGIKEGLSNVKAYEVWDDVKDLIVFNHINFGNVRV